MKFKSLSVILPTLRETDSFLKTVHLITDTCQHDDIEEIIVVVCDATTKEAMEYIKQGEEYSKKCGITYHILHQKRPYLGGAMIDGFEAANGSHVIMETPDLSTAPEELPKLISLAKEYPNDIISCSRWVKGSGFENYPKFKKAWNYLSQKFLQILYFTNVSDFTWGAHLGPTVLFRSLNYKELKHPITVEEVVIPLRLGVRFHEISGTCHIDENDISVNPLWANLVYLRPAFRWRFSKKQNLLRENLNQENIMNTIRN